MDDEPLPKDEPKPLIIDRRAFLEPELWDELKAIAKFHRLVFREFGSTQRVSRNDMLRAFVKASIKAYWKDKGGKPSGKNDELSKAKRHAEALRERARKGKKDKENSD